MNHHIDPGVQQWGDEIAQQCVRQHAVWKPDVFQSFVRIASRLKQRWAENQSAEQHIDIEPAERVVIDYLRLVGEGIGAGYLRRPSSTTHSPWNNLLESFVNRAVFALKGGQASIANFAEIWNLNEGLQREPEWVNAFVMTQFEQLPPDQWTDMPGKLTETLSTVLTAPKPSAWTGPLQTTIVKPDLFDTSFLPGEITPVAPRVVSIRDRRRASQLGLLLRENGKSMFLGPLSETTPYIDQHQVPTFAFDNDQIQIGSQSAKTPHFDSPYTSTILSSGFVIATTRNSQRVWVVESVN